MYFLQLAKFQRHHPIKPILVHMKVSELLANAEFKRHITQYFGIREKEYKVVEVKIRRRNVLHL
jgi:hypothetical protein